MSHHINVADVTPKTLPAAGYISESSASDLKKLLNEHRLSDAEYKKAKEIIGRLPTLPELGVFSSMWSEHCSYKSSRVHLKRLPTTGPRVVVGPGENAGVVRLKDKLCLTFKMESHNHPSYIEPFQGAATGVGGILRDVFCMGSRPIANLNCLRFGAKSHKKTARLLQEATNGIGHYGNCIGVPTVGGSIVFDPTYNGNCLVNAMTVGVIHEDRIFKGYATGKGNYVVYVGSATGRDGVRGATMASGSFESADTQEKSTIQVGDPFTEKLLLETTLEVLAAGLVIGIQDMGAAGLTSSSFEMAGRAGNGLYINLDLVPVRAKAMTAYELMLSESQERMLMVVEPKNWPALQAIFAKWGLAHAVIGQVTDTGRVIATYKGVTEIDIPVNPLTDDAPRYDRPQEARERSIDAEYDHKVAAKIQARGMTRLLEECLGANGNNRPVFNKYDRHIGASSVLESEHDGAAVLWLRSEWAQQADHLGVAISTAGLERYCKVDPKLGAAHTVLRAARMIAATGSSPLAVTDCLNYGNPELPQVMWELAQGVDGIGDACRALDIPVVSGNVSLYNDTDGESVHPTPMIGMVGEITDVRRAVPARTAESGHLYLLKGKNSGYSGQMRFGGSLAAALVDAPILGGELPVIDYVAEREAMAWLQHMAVEGGLMACRDLGRGGLAPAMVKICITNGGLRVTSTSTDASPSLWFGEWAGAYLIVSNKEIVRESDQLRHCEILPIGHIEQRSGAHRFPFGEVDPQAVQSAYDKALTWTS